MSKSEPGLRLRVSDACLLRLLDESDADELYRLVEANRAHLSRWMPWAAGQTLEGTLDFIRLTDRQLADNTALQTALVRDGGLIGMSGFHTVDWQHRAGTIGYWIGEAHQGEGTMTQAVRVLVDHAFGTWKLNRVEVRAAPENLRSRAIPERLGFREEGRLRQAERFGDRYVDSVVYGLLASEWRSTA
ncbi:MAG TPA: GNAT family protein [Solirubrobacteraceae bacterium]|jgi:ribosomal-protein-serine acetyltransferase|nr:GNAT family protein [Solirubrobacteraceae bacterium]